MKKITVLVGALAFVLVLSSCGEEKKEKKGLINKERVEEIKEEVKEKAEEVKEDIEETAEEVSEEVKEGAEEVKEDLKDDKH